MHVFQVKARALCSATESEDKIVVAMRNVLNLEKMPDAKIARLTGIFGEPLSVIEVELSGEDAERAAKYIISKLDKRYIRERTERGKTHYILHARIDKQTAYHGVMMTSEEDPVKIEIRTVINPLMMAERNLDE